MGQTKNPRPETRHHAQIPGIWAVVGTVFIWPACFVGFRKISWNFRFFGVSKPEQISSWRVR